LLFNGRVDSFLEVDSISVFESMSWSVLSFKDSITGSSFSVSSSAVTLLWLLLSSLSDLDSDIPWIWSSVIPVAAWIWPLVITSSLLFNSKVASFTVFLSASFCLCHEGIAVEGAGVVGKARLLMSKLFKVMTSSFKLVSVFNLSLFSSNACNLSFSRATVVPRVDKAPCISFTTVKTDCCSSIMLSSWVFLGMPVSIGPIYFLYNWIAP